MSKAKVLIIEDEKPLREVYEIILSNAGYAVETAVNGQEGLEALAHNEPDFVLLDVFMPVMNGVEFMRALAPEKRASIAIVVFSNNSDTGVRDDMINLGAKKVILKADLTPDGLVQMVGKYLPPWK